MPVKRMITEPDGVYFITITCHQWLPLIDQTNGYDLVYNWFDHLKGKGHYINGYVIMPNHLHALIAFRNTGQSKRGVLVEQKNQKAIQQKLRFSDVATTHTMRRTAITTMLSLGVPEQVVRKISGHSPSGKEFYRYVLWAQTYQDKETEKMFDKLGEKRLMIENAG